MEISPTIRRAIEAVQRWRAARAEAKEVRERTRELRSEAEQLPSIRRQFPKLCPHKRPAGEVRDAIFRARLRGEIKGCCIPSKLRYYEWEEFAESVPPKHRGKPENGARTVDDCLAEAIRLGLLPAGATESDFLAAYKADETPDFRQRAMAELRDHEAGPLCPLCGFGQPEFPLPAEIPLWVREILEIDLPSVNGNRICRTCFSRVHRAIARVCLTAHNAQGNGDEDYPF